ncbi:MAG: cation transporter [Bacteroidaceae bacterium]|nr:cation transporter [Bacteroidaceae bacterium]
MQYKEHHNHTTGNIKTAFWLNLFFTVLAFVGGHIMNSNAIKAESVHNLGCTFTIGSAWFFQWLSEKKQFKSFSFGMGRIPLIGAIISAIVIFTSSILIITESIGAIEIHHSHGDIVAEGMIWISLTGIAIKGFAAYRTRKASGENERLVSIHMIADTMGWATILIAGIILLFVHIPLLDSALSIAISTYIIINVVGSSIRIFSILFDRVPAGISIDKIKDIISSINGIEKVEDIKIWSLDGENSAAIVQILPKVYSEENNKKIRQHITECLSDFNISETYVDFK